MKALLEVIRVLKDEIMRHHEEAEGWRKMATAMMNDNHRLVNDLLMCNRRLERLVQRVRRLEGHSHKGTNGDVPT